jgi:hypothetical protein
MKRARGLARTGGAKKELEMICIPDNTVSRFS